MRRSKKDSLGFFGNCGQFTLIYREMRMSDAYRVLTPTQKLVLLDMIRMYRKVSRGDKQYPKGGFEYVWAVCEEDVSESVFYRARQRLVDVGFFDYPPEIQTLRSAAPTQFSPSREWARYKATPSEAQAISERNKAKKKRIKKKQRRVTMYRASHNEN